MKVGSQPHCLSGTALSSHTGPRRPLVYGQPHVRHGPALRPRRRQPQPQLRDRSFHVACGTNGAVAGDTDQESFLSWMTENKCMTSRIILADRPDSEDTDHRLKSIHYVLATEEMQAGDLAMTLPEGMYITLEQIFKDETVAELLTTNKLSELAVLALYLMYEKKRGEESFWTEYIHELDRQAARGQNAVQSPLLWDTSEVEDLLQGSPAVAMIQGRLKAIEREYEELDTVWFMAGSLFQDYPYDIPTEAFSFELFKTAFAVVLSCVVHLQGVNLARRFALVPLGPPFVSYSTTSRNMIAAQEDSSVALQVNTPSSAGSPIEVWCGPQPNSRLLLNYGFVDDSNPYDKVTVKAALSKQDPCFQEKKALLQKMALGTTESFGLKRDEDLAEGKLLSFLQVALMDNPEDLARMASELDCSPSSEGGQECTLGQQHNYCTVLALLNSFCAERLAAYKRTLEEDEALLAGNALSPKERVACQLLACEKRILKATMSSLATCAGAECPLDSQYRTDLCTLRLA